MMTPKKIPDIVPINIPNTSIKSDLDEFGIPKLSSLNNKIEHPNRKNKIFTLLFCSK